MSLYRPLYRVELPGSCVGAMRTNYDCGVRCEELTRPRPMQAFEYLDSICTNCIYQLYIVTYPDRRNTKSMIANRDRGQLHDWAGTDSSPQPTISLHCSTRGRSPFLLVPSSSFHPHFLPFACSILPLLVLSPIAILPREPGS